MPTSHSSSIDIGSTTHAYVVPTSNNTNTTAWNGKQGAARSQGGGGVSVVSARQRKLLGAFVGTAAAALILYTSSDIIVSHDSTTDGTTSNRGRGQLRKRIIGESGNNKNSKGNSGDMSEWEQKRANWLARLNESPPKDRSQLILAVPKQRPFGSNFVSSREEDVCRVPTSADAASMGAVMAKAKQRMESERSAAAGKPNTNNPNAAIIPMCPLGSSSFGSFAGGGNDDSSQCERFTQRLSRDGGDMTLATNATLKEWSSANPLLSPLNRGRIAIKALKFAVNSIGCDALIEVNPITSEYHDIRMTTAVEYMRDMSVLVMGGAFGYVDGTAGGLGGSGKEEDAKKKKDQEPPPPAKNNDDEDAAAARRRPNELVHIETNVIAKVLSADLPPEHALPPRINIMTIADGIDGGEASLKCFGEIKAKSSMGRQGGGGGDEDSLSLSYIASSLQSRLKALKHQKSSAIACSGNGGSDGKASSSSTDSSSTMAYPPTAPELSHIPSETFNSVLAFDRLRSVPPSQLCDTVRELLRVTKVGGAVWVGHIDDPQQVAALTECRIPTDECYGSNNGLRVRQDADGTTHNDGANQENENHHPLSPKNKSPITPKRFTLSFVSLRESFWFRYFLKPTYPLMERGPMSFVWRKVAIQDEGESEVNAQPLAGGKKVKKLNLAL